MVLDGAPALPMVKGSAVPFPHFSAQFVLAQTHLNNCSAVLEKVY